jgi:hypothetical protein
MGKSNTYQLSLTALRTAEETQNVQTVTQEKLFGLT